MRGVVDAVLDLTEVAGERCCWAGAVGCVGDS